MALGASLARDRRLSLVMWALFALVVISMAVVDLMFPLVYGGNLVTVALEFVLLAIYLGLAWMAAYEHPA